MGMSTTPDDRFTYVGSGGDPQGLSAFVPTPEQRARQAEGMTNLRRAWAAAGTAAPCAYCRGTLRTPKGRCESCGAQVTERKP